MRFLEELGDCIPCLNLAALKAREPDYDSVRNNLISLERDGSPVLFINRNGSAETNAQNTSPTEPNKQRSTRKTPPIPIHSEEELGELLSVFQVDGPSFQVGGTSILLDKSPFGIFSEKDNGIINTDDSSSPDGIDQHPASEGQENGDMLFVMDGVNS